MPVYSNIWMWHGMLFFLKSDVFHHPKFFMFARNLILIDRLFHNELLYSQCWAIHLIVENFSLRSNLSISKIFRATPESTTHILRCGPDSHSLASDIKNACHRFSWVIWLPTFHLSKKWSSLGPILTVSLSCLISRRYCGIAIWRTNRSRDDGSCMSRRNLPEWTLVVIIIQ